MISFIVQKEEYILTLLRYVELNPLRAKIVNDSFINKDEKKMELDHIRNSIDRQTPLGDENW